MISAVCTPEILKMNVAMSVVKETFMLSIVGSQKHKNIKHRSFQEVLHTYHIRENVTS